jgi:hypothetical protein
MDVRDYKAQQVQDFLKKMGILESSGGTNLNHPEVTSGLNAGTSAVGTYGLMPLTAQDLDRQYRVNELQGMNSDEVSDKLKEEPELQERLASTLANKLLTKKTPEEAAYSWEHGQNSKPSPDQLENSDRVRKFRVLNNGQ